MTFYIRSTASPLHLYRTKLLFKKEYNHRILAQKDAKKVESISIQASRIDVVELSKAAKLYIESKN